MDLVATDGPLHNVNDAIRVEARVWEAEEQLSTTFSPDLDALLQQLLHSVVHVHAFPYPAYSSEVHVIQLVQL